MTIMYIGNLGDFMFRRLDLLHPLIGIVKRYGEGDSLVFLRFSFIVFDDPKEVGRVKRNQRNASHRPLNFLTLFLFIY